MCLRLAIILGLLISTSVPVAASPCGDVGRDGGACCPEPATEAVDSCCAVPAEPVTSTCCGSSVQAVCEPTPQPDGASNCCTICPCCTPGAPDQPLPPVTKPQYRVADALSHLTLQYTIAPQGDSTEGIHRGAVDSLSLFASHNQRQAIIEVWRD